MIEETSGAVSRHVEARRPTSASALFLTFLLAGAARAGQPELEAKALFKEANQLAEEGNYAGAAELFRTAYARFPSSKILWNLATVLERMDRKAEAADTYAQYILNKDSDVKKRTEAAQRLVALEAQVGKLQILVPEPGASVVLDGRQIGQGTSFTVRVDPGGHTVVAERVGAPAAAATIDVPVGTERAITLRPGAIVGQPERPAESVPAPAAVARPAPPPPAGPAEAEPAVVTAMAPARATLDHRGQLGLTVRSETDARTGETGPSAGLTFGATSWLEVAALVLIQENKGARVSASAFALDGAWKPFARLGVPMFFVDGARPGVHVAGGLLWDVAPYAGVLLDAGIEHFPTVPEPFKKTAVVVGVGVQARAF